MTDNKYTPFLTAEVQGTVTQPLKLSVVFGTDVSGVMKITSIRKNYTVYINDYQMIYQLSTLDNITQIGVRGPFTVKAFPVGDTGKAAAYSASFAAETIYVDGHCLKVNKTDDEVQEAYKYSLLSAAYNQFEDDRVIIRGKCNPDVLYNTIVKLHQKLYPSKPVPTKRTIDTSINKFVDGKRKIHEDIWVRTKRLHERAREPGEGSGSGSNMEA